MFWNAIDEPSIYRTRESEWPEEEEHGKYGVWHPVLKFTDMPDYKGRELTQIIDDLREETGANYGYDSGCSEGTFFFDSLPKARKAAKIIMRHVEKMCADANKREPSCTSLTVEG